MKYIYLLSLIFFIHSFSFAQGNYKPGYVVKLNGDTLQGYIEYKGWPKNPREINFKASLDSTAEITRFSTMDISFFEVTGFDRYKRFIVKISTGWMLENAAAAKTDIVFLKMISSGKSLTLYGYSDNVKDRYFIDENNGNPVELLLYIMPDPNNPNESKRVESYKRQLESFSVKYFGQNQSLINEIEETGYNEEDLKKIIFELNGSDRSSEYVSPEKYRFRPVLGVGINKLSVSNYGTGNIGILDDHKNNTYSVKNSVAEEINFGEDLFFSKSERSLILRTIINMSYSSNNKIYGNAGDSLLEKYNVFTFGINPQLMFNLYTDATVKFYLVGGIEAFFFSLGKVSYQAPAYINYFDDPVRRGFDLSFTTRAEIDLKNSLGFYIGYDPVSAIGQTYNKLSTMHAEVNYFFGK